jgi:uncharacterized protein (DUF302 family)
LGLGSEDGSAQAKEAPMAKYETYGIYTESAKPFPEALQAMRDALKEQGFGVLWEIDVKATMKAKLGVEFDDYVILGACNPPIAHKALTVEKNIGLLLPCNCIVRREGEKTVFGALEPHELMDLTGRNDILPLADEIAAALERAVEAAAK